MSSLPPPPDSQVLSLVGALSNTEHHDLHVSAIRARDEALSASPASYGNLCVQLGCVLAGSDQPAGMMSRMEASQLEHWRQTDPSTAVRLQQQESGWVPFGQMAGLILKQALLRPPILGDGRAMSLSGAYASQIKEILLYCLGCRHGELRAVASTVVATTAVSPDSVQPALSVSSWPDLMPILVSNLKQSSNVPLVQASLATVRKMMEDGPSELRPDDMDALIPVLLQFLSSHDETAKVAVLQCINACLTEGLMPSALVVHFGDYLGGLSALAIDPSPIVRMWVCRSIVLLLCLRTEYVAPHMGPISQFMLQSTADTAHPEVALDACEFWLTFGSLSEDVCTPDMVEVVESLLPTLLPVLLHGMVYSPEKQEELKSLNEMELREAILEGHARPVFHKSRAKRGTEAGDSDDEDDDEDDDDDEGNEWTLRKCSAASLDSLAGLFGPDPILPCLLPALQSGITSGHPWIEEASILALGAIADGCRETMSSHLTQLHPYLLAQLALPESPEALPQLKSIAAWTIGRYASWAVEQVQMGTQGHLLAHITEVCLTRLNDRNRRVQVACCSALGVLMEEAGDLMVPYLEPLFHSLALVLPRYQSRSLLIVLDTFGIIADCVGSAIGEGNLPSIFVPRIMQIWDARAKQDPLDRTLLPLMESLASIALVCGNNFQPYALETFETAMCLVESVSLLLVTSGDNLVSDEDADPIVCAADLLDGLVEGLGPNFATLVSSSQRYGPHFLSMLHGLTRHEIAAVRMSSFAVVGDVARNAPTLLEPALPELLTEAVTCLDPVQPSVCNNAVWAVGEICVRCGGNREPLKPCSENLVQGLTALLMGNGDGGSSGRGSGVPGLPENAATTMGRLANVDAEFVSADLPRFLVGWCDGLANIADPTERREAYQGFIRAVYSNPGSIHMATSAPVDTILSIVFAIVSWHMPQSIDSNKSNGGWRTDITLQPFPQSEAELGGALMKLLQDIKTSAGEETWREVQNQAPVNVRQLLRETYRV